MFLLGWSGLDEGGGGGSCLFLGKGGGGGGAGEKKNGSKQKVICIISQLSFTFHNNHSPYRASFPSQSPRGYQVIT